MFSFQQLIQRDKGSVHAVVGILLGRKFLETYESYGVSLLLITEFDIEYLRERS